MAEPELIIDGPDGEGRYRARWPALDGAVGTGASAEAARDAAFSELVESLRAGLSEEERAHHRRYASLSLSERMRRSASLYETTWHRRR